MITGHPHRTLQKKLKRNPVLFTKALIVDLSLGKDGNLVMDPMKQLGTKMEIALVLYWLFKGILKGSFKGSIGFRFRIVGILLTGS